MAENSKIEWTHHTFNAWRGCTKISPGCANCYAETLSLRNPKTLGVWGNNGTRVGAAESYWHLPLKWDKAAAKAGERRRVFCASLADVFEDHPLILPEWRARLFSLIKQTPNLDWMLLTKRPENFSKFLPSDWGMGYHNVWLGITAENQVSFDIRWPFLKATTARIRFASLEPLLGPIHIRPAVGYPSYKGNIPGICIDINHETWHRDGELCRDCGWGYPNDPDRPNYWIGLDLVIVGGESGSKARPMHPDWVKNLRKQCIGTKAKFFFKQWGEWLPWEFADPPFLKSQNGQFRDGHGMDIQDHETGEDAKGWNSGLEFIGKHSHVVFQKVGKQAAGRLLDGVEWNELPKG